MEFVDTHCHLNHPQFEGADGVAVRDRARAAGVTRLLCIGYDEASSRRAVELTQTPGLYAAIGLHPDAGAEWSPETAGRLRTLWQVHPNRVVAWGEIGLDYHWDTLPRPRQQDVFREQIAFARDLSSTLPLIIHCRDAQDDVLAVLRESATPAPVIMHCFTGETPQAKQCLDEAGHL